MILKSIPVKKTDLHSSVSKSEIGIEDANKDTTGTSELEDPRGKRKENTKHSEASDLEKVDEAISLINDTYVNYSHYYKTSTDRSLGPGSENGTNFHSKDTGVSHEHADPKEEVEVVRDVTHSPIQRIVIEETADRNSSITEKSAKVDSESKLNPELSNDGSANDANSTNAKNIAKIDQEGDKDEEKLEITTTPANRNFNEETSTSTGAVPRGRTIAFSGVNDFSNLETKPTATSKEIDALRKNSSVEKPYPYAKSTREPAAVRNSSRLPTTEEASYENTIGRGQSEKKFVITEPSVVIENSIQQIRPNYYEKLTNSSTNSTTPSSAPATVAPLLVDRSNKTQEEAYVDPKTSATPEKSTAGNDVSEGNDEGKVIAGKDDSFDVTGNGITEVSLKPETPETDEKRPYEGEATFHPGGGNASTQAPTDSTRKQTEAKMISNLAGRTNAESLLIRSTLNVTEASTEYPLTDGTSGKSSSVLVNSTVRSIASLATGNATEETSTVVATSDVNVTNEIPSGVATLGPDESSVPTTTVEYEFVGLSEATALPTDNVTEGGVGGNATVLIPTVFAPTVEDATTREPLETTTIFVEPENSSNTEALVDDGSSTNPTTEQTLVPTTTSMGEELTTRPTVEEETDQISTKEEDGLRTSVTEPWSTTSEDFATSTESAFTAQDTKDSIFVSNVSESVTTTDSVLIYNTSLPETTRVPFVPSTMKPRILVTSSTGATPNTEAPTVRPTDVVETPLSPEEITSLVRIVMNGSLQDVCPHIGTLRMTLADLLRSGMKKAVYAKQIMFHQNPCREPTGPAPTSTDVSLTSILVYVVDENGKFDSTMTNILPSLYGSVPVQFPVTIHSFLLVQEADPGNAIAVVVVSSVAFICLVLLAGLLFIMRKRQTRFNYGERCRPVSLDAYSLDSVSAYNSVRRKGAVRSSKRSYGNPTFEDSSAIPSHPLNFAGLSSFCNDVNAINEEFAGVPQVSAKIDELPAGAEVKNRYANVIPLPETRVPLQKMNNDPLTEYINASYVRGPRNATRYYIACQGPMDTTVTDFWRMIWEQQSKVIIMLTDLVENGVEKCTEYIPPSEVTDCHRLYGDFQVTLKKRETKEKYAISTLHLKNLENNTFREVYHIWYLWPVNGVQSDGAGLIAVLLEARALQRGGPGPIVVHCSPGTGRTGTLIALDLGIRQYEITRTVDVPRVVYTIRRDRAGAVQTKEQYAFIYKSLNLYATKLAGGVLEST